MDNLNNQNIKKRTITSLVWKFAEKSGAQIVTFLVSVVLARILDPDIYGSIALVTVIMSILQVFVDSGLGNALIQKKDSDELDFSTVFYFNIFACAILYVLLFISAPIIAYFYEMPHLVNIIRVLGITLIISGLRNIQQAYVSKHLQFRKFFFSTLGGSLSAAIVGIAMAIKGFGIWALVFQHVFNLLAGTIILWITVKWRPKKMFSWQRFKGLFNYGWKLLLSSFIDTIYNEIRQLIIGKKYSPESLAFYNQGRQFPNLIVTNINTSIDSVLLPVLSQAQSNRQTVKMMTRRAIKVSSFVIMPFMVGLAVCAEPIVRLILTEKWLFCVPYLRIFCFTYAFYPLHTANLNAIKALGRSDLFLKLEIIKKTIGMILLLSTMWFGVMVMAYSLLVSAIISTIINSFPNNKLLGYSYLEQLKDILPVIFISLIMGAAVYIVQYLNIADIYTLLIQIPLGVILYIVLSKIFKIDSFEYVLKIIKKIFIKKTAGREIK